VGGEACRGVFHPSVPLTLSKLLCLVEICSILVLVTVSVIQYTDIVRVAYIIMNTYSCKIA